MGDLLRRRGTMQKSASGPQHIKVYLSSATTTSGKMKKRTGSTGSVGNSSYATVPYYDGMHIYTHLNTTWVSDYKYAVLYNGSTYQSVAYTLIGSGTGYKWFEATLSGFTGITEVYINCRSSQLANAYYEYDA